MTHRLGALLLAAVLAAGRQTVERFRELIDHKLAAASR